MTYARFTAATVAMTIALTALAQTPAPAAAPATPVLKATTSPIEPLEPLAEISPTNAIADVRIVAGDERAVDIRSSVDKFENAGWPLSNLEIRAEGEDGCGGNAGVRLMEQNLNVIEICTEAEWALLHELGHVWAALYLDDDERQEWVELRGLDVWSGGDKWEERGTEQLADIVAFGLFDEWHTPISIAPNDRKSLIASFEWLFGMEPLSMQDGASNA